MFARIWWWLAKIPMVLLFLSSLWCYGATSISPFALYVLSIKYPTSLSVFLPSPHGHSWNLSLNSLFRVSDWLALFIYIFMCLYVFLLSMRMEIYILVLGCGSLIEFLPSMLESMCSIPYMTRGREGRRERGKDSQWWPLSSGCWGPWHSHGNLGHCNQVVEVGCATRGQKSLRPLASIFVRSVSTGDTFLRAGTREIVIAKSKVTENLYLGCYGK